MAIKLSLFIKNPYRREDKKINRGDYLVKKNISAWNLTDMNIDGIIWLETVAAKIKKKHHVSPEESEQVFTDKPKFYFIMQGERANENVYLALGQTDTGRYLAVFFIYKKSKDALILSARKMAQKERKRYCGK